MTQDDSPVPHEARRQLDEIPLDQDLVAALQDPAHPGHKAVSTRRRELYAAAYPEGDGDTIGGGDTSDPHGDRNFLSPPADPKDYRFDPPPPGVSYDTVLEQKARDWFHEAGIPQWLARNVAREWNRAIEDPPDEERVASNAATTEKSLRQHWGERYDAKIETARSLIRSLKSDEVVSLLDRSGLANNEYVVRQLVALAESRGSR